MSNHKSIEAVKDGSLINASNKNMINTFSISANGIIGVVIFYIDSLLEKEIKLIKDENKSSNQTVKMNRSDCIVIFL